MSVLLALARRISGRFLVFACVASVLIGAHFWDRSRAVSAARDGFVARVQLAEAQAQLLEARRRAGVADRVNYQLKERVVAAQGRAASFARDLEAFRSETEINPDCVVDHGFLRRLQSD